jgi:hypothetical protein
MATQRCRQSLASHCRGPGSIPASECEIFSKQSGTGIGFSLRTLISTVNVIPQMLNTHLNTSLIRSTSGQNLETPKRSSALLDKIMHWTENYFHVSFFWSSKG